MAILFCRKCGYFREIRSQYTGKSVICPQCRHTNTIHDTMEFFKRIIEKYRAQNRALRKLKEQFSPADSTESADSADSGNSTIDDRQLLADIDIHNTTTLTDPRQYEPIVEWMKKKNIQIEIDHQAIDTTGFFDEIAVQLGDHYETLQLVGNQIKFAQSKSHASARIMLSKSTEGQVDTILNFCRELHDYSFISRYFYNKKEKFVRLILQNAPAIVKFFNGEWMEWYAFMKILNFFRENGVPVACLRSFHIVFTNREKYEIDGLFLVRNEMPLVVECKTGEFRHDIHKYSILRKKLKLNKTQFMICAIGLNDKQIQGFNSMYDVTFANESNFLDHVGKFIRR